MMLIAICAVAFLNPLPVSDPDARQYNCAVDAAFAAMHYYNRATGFDAIANCFPERYRPPRVQVPMDVLTGVLEEGGLSASSVRFKSTTGQGISAPVILLIHPENRSGDQIGHYVFVTSATESHVEFFDPRLTEQLVRVEKSELPKIWDGYAVLFTTSPRREILWFLPWVLGPIALYQLIVTFFAAAAHRKERIG